MIDLKSILEQHPNCLASRASFKSTLLDKYPSEKRQVNVLTALYECGVANKIRAKKSIDINEMHALIAQIENEHGISGQYSQEAILVWAAALGVTATSVVITEATPKAPEIPIEQKTIAYVPGDASEYDIAERPNGYYITRFNGFEEEDMTIPSLIGGKKIKGIAHDAFMGCVGVRKMRISEGIEIIEGDAFNGCKSLMSVSLPNTLKKIGTFSKINGRGVFEGMHIRKIDIPPNVVYIGPRAFQDCCELSEISLPPHINYIGFSAFQGCREIEEITIPNNITTISKRTFYGCRKLTQVRLPSNLETIDEEAFLGCSIREIHIPIGTKKILEDALYCSSLSAAYIPPSVSEIKGKFWRESLTIYCAAGSTAKEYARTNNIKCAKAQF